MTPETPQVAGLVQGGLALGFLIAAVFFLKFWHRTRDALFAAFAAAFALFAFAQPLPLLINAPGEALAPIYLVRLAGFALIIWAVLRKNLSIDP
jgi:hypothetical protein